ncbi:ribonuclease P protein component [Candidatus Saccharibacteria bacterium QS_8_54_8]|nr:MAG: ribonuclease P protein component [Candidatus Saccharibacteria bacterium QS_8_54_8]
MLKQPNRLRRQKDFARVFKHGDTVHMPAFTVKYHANHHPSRTRVAVVISSKVAKRAVIRNRTRRRFYGQVQLLWPRIRPGMDVVILLRRQATDLRGAQLAEQLRSCFYKAGILH